VWLSLRRSLGRAACPGLRRVVRRRQAGSLR
jgi:hypothetical protein